MAYVKVSKEFVIEKSRFMILKINQIDAIEANKVIDRLMARKTWFTRRPFYNSRTDCIKKEQDWYRSELCRAFQDRPQLIACQKLLIAAQNCQEDCMYLTEDDISSLGLTTAASVEYLQHFWDLESNGQ